MIKIKRFVEQTIEMDGNKTGICWNESMARKRIVKVRAGDEMCPVGLIRRGRTWGIYDGIYCAECPYFITEESLEHPDSYQVKLLKKLRERVKL